MYVLDLRGNMGGLLTAGIRLVEDLLPYGRVITSLEGFSLSLSLARARARARAHACLRAVCQS